MKKKIWIKIEALEFEGFLNDTRIAGLILEALPIRAAFNLWGDEIYFPIPVQVKEMEDPRKTVTPGDLGYWPDGNCFCIFYGQTPISSPGTVKPASDVEIIGRVEDPEGFKRVKGPGKVTISRG